MEKSNLVSRKKAIGKAFLFTLFPMFYAAFLGYVLSQSSSVDQVLVEELNLEIDNLTKEKTMLSDYLRLLGFEWKNYTQNQEEYFDALDQDDEAYFSLHQDLETKNQTIDSILLVMQQYYPLEDSVGRSLVYQLGVGYRSLLTSSKIARKFKEDYVELERVMDGQDECITQLQQAQEELNRLVIKSAKDESNAYLLTITQKENGELKEKLREEQMNYKNLTKTLSINDDALRFKLVNLEGDLDFQKRLYQSSIETYINTLIDTKFQITNLQKHRNLDCMRCCGQKMQPVRDYLDQQLQNIRNFRPISSEVKRQGSGRDSNF